MKMMKKRSRSWWSRPKTVRQALKITFIVLSIFLLISYVAFAPVWGRGPRGVSPSKSHLSKKSSRPQSFVDKRGSSGGENKVATYDSIDAYLSTDLETIDGVSHFKNCKADLAIDQNDGDFVAAAVDGRGSDGGDLSYKEELMKSLLKNITEVRRLEYSLAMEEAGFRPARLGGPQSDQRLLSKATDLLDLHLFAVWPGAMKHLDRIVRDISKKFIILKIARIDWTQKEGSAQEKVASLSTEAKFLYFEENLWRLYSGKGGIKRATMKMKVSQCGGVGPFVVLLVADPNPQYVDEITAHGSDHVNKNMFAAKKLYRKWSGEGGFRVHGTYSSLEAEHDARILLGQRPLAAALEAFSNSGNAMGEEKKDISDSTRWDKVRGIADTFLSQLKMLKAVDKHGNLKVGGANGCTTTSAGTVGFPPMITYYTTHPRPPEPPKPSLPLMPQDPMPPGAEQNRRLERLQREKEKEFDKDKNDKSLGANIAEIDGALAVGDLFADPVAVRIAPMFVPVFGAQQLRGPLGTGGNNNPKFYHQIPTEMVWESCDAFWFALGASSSTLTAPSDGTITPFYAADEADASSTSEGLSFFIIGTSQPHPSGSHRFLTMPFDWRAEDRRRLTRNQQRDAIGMLPRSSSKATESLMKSISHIPSEIQRCARVSTYVSPERIRPPASNNNNNLPGQPKLATVPYLPYNFAFSGLSPIAIPMTVPLFAMDDGDENVGRRCKYQIPEMQKEGAAKGGDSDSEKEEEGEEFDFDDDRVVAWTMNLIIRAPQKTVEDKKQKDLTNANKKLLAAALNNLIASTYGTVLSPEGRDKVLWATGMPFPAELFLEAMDLINAKNIDHNNHNTTSKHNKSRRGDTKHQDNHDVEWQQKHDKLWQSLPPFNAAPSIALRMQAVTAIATSPCNMGRGMAGIVRPYGLLLAAQRSHVQSLIDESLEDLKPQDDVILAKRKAVYGKGKFRFQRSEDDILPGLPPPPPPLPMAGGPAEERALQQKKKEAALLQDADKPLLADLADYFGYRDAPHLFERATEQSAMGDSVRCDGGAAVMFVVTVRHIGRVFIDVCMQL